MSTDNLGCTIFAISAVILAISTFNVFDKQEKFTEVEDTVVRNSPGPSFQSTVKLEEYQNRVVMNVGTSVENVNKIGAEYYLNLQNYLNPSIQNLELAQNIDRIYPYLNPSNHFDYLLCIAVIHHLPTEEERIITITKCINLLKKGGHALFTTWAFEQSYTDNCGAVFTTSKPRTFPNAGDNIVSWNKNKIDDGAINQINHKNKKVVADRYYYIYTYEKWCLLWENVKSRLQMIDNNLDIHITIGYEEQNWVANVIHNTN